MIKNVILLLCVLALPLVISNEAGAIEPTPLDQKLASLSEETSKLDRSVEYLGSTRSLIADDLFLLVERAESVAANSDDIRPVIIGADDLQKLLSDEAKRLKSILSAGVPVLLLSPTPENVETLNEALDSGHIFGAPDAPTLDAYGVRCETEDNCEVATFYAPNSPQSLMDGPEERALSENIRAAVIADWLFFGASATIEAPVSSIDAKRDLHQLIKAWTSNAYWPDRYGTFRLTSHVWQAHSKVQGQDWFHLRSQGVFNPSAGFTTRSTLWRPIRWREGSEHCGGDFPRACWYQGYVTGYGLSARPTEGRPEWVGLFKSTPETTTGGRDVTYGLEWSLGGSVVAGTEGAAVGVSAGISVNNSTTQHIPDVSVSNQSAGRGNDAYAIFQMPDSVVGPGERCWNYLVPPRPVQVQTFQPAYDSVWFTKRDLRQQQSHFTVDLSLEVKRGDSLLMSWPGDANPPGRCNIFSCDCKITPSHYSWTFTHRLQIPFPATTAPK